MPAPKKATVSRKTTAPKSPAPPPNPVVTFRGRNIKIKIPGGAQVMMWSRVASQFGKVAETEPVDKDEFRKVLDRLTRMVMSLFTSDDDKDWLEDQIIDGEIVDTDLLDLFKKIGSSIKALANESDQVEPNRAARRVKTKA
jgi:hypothetical protein